MADINPIPDSEMPGTTPKASASNAQNKEFGGKAEAFYSWYQSIRQLNFPTEGYHGLQYIMNISEQGTATKEEADIASEKLNQLMEEIDGGSQTLDKIPHELEKIVDGLTNHNAKSRVVMQATKIQISVNLSESDISEEVNQVMNSLLGRVTKEMPNIKAEEISRTLQDAIDHSEGSKSLRQKVLSLLKPK
jgi:uncharacterized protein YoxC